MRHFLGRAAAVAALLFVQFSTAYRRQGADRIFDEEQAASRRSGGGDELAWLRNPFSLKGLNDAYHKSLAKTAEPKALPWAAKGKAPSAHLDPFVGLMAKFHSGTDREIEVESLIEDFAAAELLFALGEISEERWEYAWKHLPSVVMDYPTVRFVLHAPSKSFKQPDNFKSIYTFAGWEIDGGSYIDVDKCTPEDCSFHIILRDIYTDLDELLSNLLLHVHFLAQHPNKTYHRCRDKKYRFESCRGRDKCWLTAEEPPPPCDGKRIKVKQIPKYTIQLSGFDAGEDQIVDVLRSHWQVWAERLRGKATQLTQCKQEDLKVHVIQGATEALWVMTSEYAMQEQPDVNLTGSYGGRYEKADRRYASFLLASKADRNMSSDLNAMNKGKHSYDPQDGPFSVSTEIIDMESWKVGKLDPVVTEKLLQGSEQGRKCGVLLNVGYAFGSAAWPMGLALKDTFGAALKSFHVIGKAGGLVGEVGDYQVSNSFFIWESIAGKSKEKVYTVDTSSVDTDLWSGGRKPQVHSGALMTVPSVVLQSHKLLDAAKPHPFNAVGIEMESFWFKKALPDTPGLYLYYTSDIPQAADSSLAHESYPWQEGQTLFNGLARMVLVQMLQDMGAPEQPPKKPGSGAAGRCLGVLPLLAALLAPWAAEWR